MDIDLLDGEMYATVPWSVYARLRAEAPVYHDEENGLWGVARHADVFAVERDPRVWTNSGGYRPQLPALAVLEMAKDRRARPRSSSPAWRPPNGPTPKGRGFSATPSYAASQNSPLPSLHAEATLPDERSRPDIARPRSSGRRRMPRGGGSDGMLPLTYGLGRSPSRLHESFH